MYSNHPFYICHGVDADFTIAMIIFITKPKLESYDGHKHINTVSTCTQCTFNTVCMYAIIAVVHVYSSKIHCIHCHSYIHALILQM